ncbi:MAG: calcium-binding protein [Inquilinus sp.]|uniref:calcium-binding protein n=1 Tax=Inquilinus sp. TaxID=1932117 RepID=UPI003F40C131
MAYIPGKDNVDDVLYGTQGGDTISGFGGNDLLFGLGDNDSLFGGSGYDILRGGAGADFLAGGADFDYAYYDDSASGVWVTIGGYGSGGTAEGDFVASDVEGLVGSSYLDILVGNESGNSLSGASGNDYLFGNGGIDSISGDSGNDVLIGGAGGDYLYGGTGSDTVDYTDSAVYVWADLKSQGYYGTAEGDRYSGIENLTGSLHDDYLLGDAVGNTLDGYTGNDYLSGYEGNDRLIGGKGADTMYGGVGEDTVSYLDSAAGVWVDLRGGTASGGDAQGDYLGKDIEDFQGSKFNDTVIGSGADNYITLQDGRDFVWAGGGRDYLFGGAGDDGLSGEGADDQVTGDAGNDTLYGGAGSDLLRGGDGNDVMTGGTEADRFSFANVDLGDTDTIKDFHRSEGDKISLSGIDANTALAGDQAFAFIGTAAFTGVAGQLHYSNNGVQTVLTGDVNGDKISDFQIVLTDAPGLIASDFHL